MTATQPTDSLDEQDRGLLVYIATAEVPPSYQELCQVAGWSSKNRAYEWVKRMAALGVLCPPAHAVRALRLATPFPTALDLPPSFCPCCRGPATLRAGVLLCKRCGKKFRLGAADG